MTSSGDSPERAITALPKRGGVTCLIGLCAYLVCSYRTCTCGMGDRKTIHFSKLRPFSTCSSAPGRYRVSARPIIGDRQRKHRESVHLFRLRYRLRFSLSYALLWRLRAVAPHLINVRFRIRLSTPLPSLG